MCLLSYDDICSMESLIKTLLNFKNEILILSSIEDLSNLCKKLLCALFSNLINFDGSSSKRHISDYDHHRKLKSDSIELYGNTE